MLSNGKGIWKFRHLISSMLEGVSQPCIFRSGVHTHAQWIAVGRKCISIRIGRGKNGNELQVMLQIFLICLHAICKRRRTSIIWADDRVAEASCPPGWFLVSAGCRCWCCSASPTSQTRSHILWRTAPYFADWMSGVSLWRGPGCLRPGHSKKGGV